MKQEVFEHMKNVAALNLALVGDESVREGFGEAFDKIKQAGNDMFKAHAKATAMLVKHMEDAGFSRAEAVSIVSSMYPNLKFYN